MLFFFFLFAPRPDAHSLTAGLGRDASRAGWCPFFCSPLTHSLRAWATTLTHSLRAWATTLPGAGGVLTHSLRAWPATLPGPLCLSFLLAPRANAHSREASRAGWCSFFCSCPTPTLTHLLQAWAATLPGLGGVLSLARAPPRRSLIHCAWAATLPRPGDVFFLLAPCPCPDAHSLTASLACDASRAIVFFFARAPPRRSLTHCGPGLQRFPGRVVLCFVRAFPDTHSLTHCGRGALFCSRPAPTLTGPGPRRFPGRVVFCFCSGLAEPGEPLTKSVWFATSDLTLGPKP